MDTVTVIGTYRFTVVSPSGCEAFKEVEVKVDTKEPDIVLFEGDVDCENGSRIFSLITDATDGTFEWTGPDGYTSSEQSPFYSKAGTYNIKITGTNGCVSEGSINIANDIAFEAEVSVDGNSASAVITGGTGPFTIIWDNNVGETSIDGLSIGSHELKVFDGLGCVKTISFEVTISNTNDLVDSYILELFPNPAQDLLNVRIEGNLSNDLNINVISITGEILESILLRNVNQEEIQLNVSGLAQGYYLLSFRSEELQTTKKFFKM
jgi:hypothetical protein